MHTEDNAASRAYGTSPAQNHLRMLALALQPLASDPLATGTRELCAVPWRVTRRPHMRGIYLLISPAVLRLETGGRLASGGGGAHGHRASPRCDYCRSPWNGAPEHHDDDGDNYIIIKRSPCRPLVAGRAESAILFSFDHLRDLAGLEDLARAPRERERRARARPPRRRTAWSLTRQRPLA